MDYLIYHFKLLLNLLNNLKIQLNIILVNHCWVSPTITVLILGIFNQGVTYCSPGCNQDDNNYIPEILSNIAWFLTPTEINEPLELQESHIYVPVITEVLEWSAGMLINWPVNDTNSEFSSDDASNSESTYLTDSDCESDINSPFLDAFKNYSGNATKFFMNCLENMPLEERAMAINLHLLTNIMIIVNTNGDIPTAELKHIVSEIMLNDPTRQFWDVSNNIEENLEINATREFIIEINKESKHYYKLNREGVILRNINYQLTLVNKL